VPGGESVSCEEDDDGRYRPPANLTCPDEDGGACQFVRFGNTAATNWMQVFNVFALLWALFFVSAWEEMAMAGAFAQWYFTRDKDGEGSKEQLASLPLTKSVYRTGRYHLGTLAFGSLIIAAIRFIRMVIEYVQKKLDEYGQDNWAAKVWMYPKWPVQ